MPTFHKIKAKCRACSLHFIVCSWTPEKHQAATLFCPECGQHQGGFEIWREEVDGYIYEEVPGKARSDDAEDPSKPLVAPPFPPGST